MVCQALVSLYTGTFQCGLGLRLAADAEGVGVDVVGSQGMVTVTGRCVMCDGISSQETGGQQWQVLASSELETAM